MNHYFNVEIAKRYGIEEAIIIENIYFWIKKNVANEVNKNDGRYWTYNSAKAFAEIFPYMSARKISRVLASLYEKDAILKGNYNELSIDRTMWYSFTDELISVMDAQKYDVVKISDSYDLTKNDTHFPKMSNGNTENDEPIAYNNPYNNKQIKEEKDKSFSKKDCIDFGSIFSAWNDVANDVDDISSIKLITDNRKKQIRTLLKSCNSTCEELVRFIKTLPYADDWVIGKGDRKWSIDFDWLIQNTSNWYVAGLEGNMHKKNRYEFDKIMRGEEVLKQSKKLDGFQYL